MMITTTDMELAFQQAMLEDPNDQATWCAFSDWLEETNQLDRCELVSLWRSLLHVSEERPTEGNRWKRELQVCSLVDAGVRLGLPVVENSVGMSFVLLPAGRFWMGSLEHEHRRGQEEGPLHLVDLTRPFFLSVFHTTQTQFKRVIGANPSWFAWNSGGSNRVSGMVTDNCPVEYVTWDSAAHFCRKLSELPTEKRAGRVYRLPTEAEWEYACRGAGALTVPFHFGITASATQSNFDGQYPYGGVPRTPYRQRPIPVGEFTPNVVGLHDMHGNVWDWCNDFFDADYYARSPRTDPPGPESGEEHVLRGGSWIDCAHNCRSAFRDRTWAGARVQSAMGVRVVLEW